ncbi:hypothetical protein INR49_029315 [Caranx melampygus]|nr:hypothetical protein INR49_029315 [Caranx melampygus]
MLMNLNTSNYLIKLTHECSASLSLRRGIMVAHHLSVFKLPLSCPEGRTFRPVLAGVFWMRAFMEDGAAGRDVVCVITMSDLWSNPRRRSATRP